jgi:CubicO group peptidase (beta-lactamase class C family)
LKYNYDAVIIGVHNYSRFPANNFGFDKSELLLIGQLQEETRAVTIAFGNPYAIRNFDKGNTIISAYDDDSLMHGTAARLLFGKFVPGGKLPVSISNRFAAGSGLNTFRSAHIILPYVPPAAVNMDTNVLKRIDTIAAEAISQKATPGCVVLGMRNGKIFLNKAYGYTDYNETVPVTLSTIYDLASCTKICATTMAIMRLYDEGRLDINTTLGSYLPWLKGSDKARLIIKDVLLHQAGLVAWIPFYRETLYDGVHPDTLLYSPVKDPAHTVRVAENLYMKADYIGTMFRLIRDSRLGPAHKYVYSDNDFILMQKVVEAITGMPLDEYVEKTFYDPLGMLSTGFKPRSFARLDRVAPTEKEADFRLQQLHGDVHDPGAAMFGGVSGHAGLFSDTYDLAILMQMLLNGGSMEGVQYIKPATIRYFTAYQSNISRRGLAWDKPEKEKERMNESDPYPCRSASPATFGHTGYTGTCIWVDPAYDFIYIFLSNRVCPDGGENRKLSTLNIRSRIQETMYEAMGIK